MPSALDAALDYAARGWRAVPVYEPVKGICSCKRGKECQSPGKHPRLTAWQTKATIEIAQIETWWRQWPSANVGVALGKASGIVDLECDTPEAEQQLLRIFSTAMPVCPTFQSQRGKHRLFRFDARLPDKAMVKLHGIEVRIGGGGKGCCSIFPPSMHAEGKRYQWLVAPDEVDPPALCEQVFDELGCSKQSRGKRTAREWRGVIQEGAAEGLRNLTATEWIGKKIGAMLDVSDSTALMLAYDEVHLWNVHRNRPPLGDEELRNTFDSIVRRERAKRLDQHFDEHLSRHVDRGLQKSNGEVQQDISRFQLVIVDSNPPEYRLKSKLWAVRKPEGITIRPRDMLNPQMIRQAAIEQCNVALPRKLFAKTWEDEVQEILDLAEHEPAPLERKRDRVIAEWLWRMVEHADAISETHDPTGSPARVADGVIFSFRSVWQPMARSDDRVTRIELSKVLSSLGAQFRWVGERCQHRFFILDDAALDNLGTVVKGSE